MRCEEVMETLPAYAGGEVELGVRRHLSRCPECRAEKQRYEELATAMSQLRGVHAEVPSGLYATLVAIPDATSRIDGVRTHVARHRKAYAGGLAIAVAAAAGTALARTRRSRLAAA